MEIRYLTVETVVDINERVIKLHTPDEPIGVDLGKLESALQRGQFVHYYEQTDDIFKIVAAIGYGVTKAHAFLNANKRTAALVVLQTLLLNGWFLQITTQDGIDTFEGLASGNTTQDMFAAWLRRHSIQTSVDEIIKTKC